MTGQLNHESAGPAYPEPFREAFLLYRPAFSIVLMRHQDVNYVRTDGSIVIPGVDDGGFSITVDIEKTLRVFDEWNSG